MTGGMKLKIQRWIGEEEGRHSCAPRKCNGPEVKMSLVSWRKERPVWLLRTSVTEKQEMKS